MGVVAVSRPHPAGHRRLADRPQLILRAARYDDLDATSRTERLGWQAGQQRRTPDGDVLRTYRRLLRYPLLSPPRGSVVA